MNQLHILSQNPVAQRNESGESISVATSSGWWPWGHQHPVSAVFVGWQLYRQTMLVGQQEQSDQKNSRHVASFDLEPLAFPGVLSYTIYFQYFPLLLSTVHNKEP